MRLKIRFLKLVVLCMTIGLFAILWGAIGPKAMANVSAMTYHHAHYSYDVSIDTVYTGPGNTVLSEEGIAVTIHPDRPVKDAPGFTEAYIQSSHEQAHQWALQRPDQLVDAMIVFTRPLVLTEANVILSKVEANVFESSVVGYSQGTPFAEYTIEAGPLLNKSLEEFAQTNYGVIPEGDSADSLDTSNDVRGYLAVRAWVPAQYLDDLLQSPDVQLLDITPQAIRDELASNRHWKSTPITSLAIEMPVWAYEW